MSRATHEALRVARALADLPATTGAFVNGLDRLRAEGRPVEIEPLFKLACRYCA